MASTRTLAAGVHRVKSDTHPSRTRRFIEFVRLWQGRTAAARPCCKSPGLRAPALPLSTLVLHDDCFPTRLRLTLGWK